jgi:hypothetical protein
MRKCVLIVGLVVISGCSSGIERWESAGTLVSVSPAEEPTRAPGRVGVALGDTEMGRTRVETTEGVYIVHGKINVAQVGSIVTVGYVKKDSLGEQGDEPAYLAFSGQRHEIVRK